jgi:hypothetical protein
MPPMCRAARMASKGGLDCCVTCVNVACSGAGGPLWGIIADAGVGAWMPWGSAAAAADHQPHRLLHRCCLFLRL